MNQRKVLYMAVTFLTVGIVDLILTYSSAGTGNFGSNSTARFSGGMMGGGAYNSKLFSNSSLVSPGSGV